MDTTCPFELLQSFTIDRVLKVYVGKPGCMCGCRGKYRVTPQNLELATKDRGYAYEKSEVNLEAVVRALRSLQADPRTAIDGDCLFVPNALLKRGEKSVVVYLIPPAV